MVRFTQIEGASVVKDTHRPAELRPSAHTASRTTPCADAGSRLYGVAWLHRGAFSGAFVAYGIDGAMGEALEAASSRIGVGGHMFLAPVRQLAISFFGAETAAESVAGTLVYFDVTSGTLQTLSWDATTCVKEAYDGSTTPASCVGEGSFFPSYIESGFTDLLGPWTTKWASPCGFAHLTTNAVSCMPTSFSANATTAAPDKHTPFPLWRGATGRIFMSFTNSTAIPAPVSAFVPPTRCTAAA